MSPCQLLPNGGFPPQRFRLLADGTWKSVPPGTPLTRTDIERACCYWQLQERYAESGQFGFLPDPVGWCASRIQAQLSDGRSVADAIWDGAWRWLFFEDLYALSGSPSSVTVANTPLTQFSYGPNASEQTILLAEAGLQVQNLSVLENVGASIAPLLGRAFFAPAGSSLELAGGSFTSARQAVMSLLPQSYWGPFVGFFDDLLGGLSSVGSAAAGVLSGVASTALDYGSAVLNQAAANPAQTAAILQQLGVIPTPAAQNLVGAMMPTINPDTGSMMSTAGSSADQFVQVLKSYLPSIVGGAATAGALEVGGDAVATIANFLGFGGDDEMMGGALVIDLAKGKKPPRRVIFRRPDGRQYEFTSRGRPLLYSGDVTAVKRVARAANRARRSRPRRRALPAPSNPEMRVICGKCMSSPCGCS